MGFCGTSGSAVMAPNRIWLQITALAADLLTWTQRLALTGPAASYEPKRLRLRILALARRLVRTARRTLLKIPDTWPWAPPNHDRPRPPGRPRALIATPDPQKGPGAPATTAGPGITPAHKPKQPGHKIK